jgi:ABC-type polysaccharide/polyol phosphate export permease
MPLVFTVGICLALLTAGIGMTLSILYIRFDDMRNIVNVLLMILMYFTPVFYPVTILSPKLQQIIQFNPLTSYLDIFRWAFSNNATATLSDWLFMIFTSILSITLGTIVFKKFWPRTVAML